MNSYELIPDGVPLSAVPGLSQGQVKVLKDVWILTAQELVALHNTGDPTRDRLAAALGLTREALAALVANAEALIPPVRDLHELEMAEAAAQAQYGLGALLDEPGLESMETLPPYEPERRAVLPESVSLLDQLPPLRNQGGRGTCVAHAVLAVREQLEVAAHSPADLDLSEQYAYWWCKAHDGIPRVSGTYVSVGMRCLAETGAPLETAWPYVNVEKEDQGQGPPPEAAAKGDPGFRILRTQQFNRADIDGIKACLYEGRAVAFSVPVYDSWYASSATARWGKITLPLPGEPQNGGHAMTLVGYQDDADAPGGGYFLVRNSWQPWSWDGTWRPGYGYIPYAYIKQFASAVYSATRITGAQVYLRDTDERTALHSATLTWDSPDIWLRQEPDGGMQHQPPQPGKPNAIYVRGHNGGPAYAYGIRVEVFAAPAAPYIRADAWQRIGHLSARWLAPGSTVLGPLSWTPPADGPHNYSLLVRISSAEQRADETYDPAATTTVAQRNTWYGRGKPAESLVLQFPLAGAAGRPGEISFRILRGNLPAGAELSAVRILLEPAEANTRGIVEGALTGALTGALLASGPTRRASLTLTLPPDVLSGAMYTFVIEQRQGTDVVGRLTAHVQVV